VSPPVARLAADTPSNHPAPQRTHRNSQVNASRRYAWSTLCDGSAAERVLIWEFWVAWAGELRRLWRDLIWL